MADDIVKQLRLAELWFCTTSAEDGTIPVERKYGKHLFQTGADTIEQLRREIRSLETKLDLAKGIVTPRQDAEKEKLRKALQEIRNKVHAHNRGGDLYAGLRDVVRDICDGALDASA